MRREITINEIIEIFEDRFDFEAGDNSEECVKFLEWQIRKHDYDMAKWHVSGKNTLISTGYHYGDICGYKLGVFLFVNGTLFIVDKDGRKRRLGRNEDGSLKPIEERVEDLKLLSYKSKRYYGDRPDSRLCKIATRIDLVRDITYAGFINELGTYKPIEEYYGRRISYKDVNERAKRTSLMIPRV